MSQLPGCLPLLLLLLLPAVAMLVLPHLPGLLLPQLHQQWPCQAHL
jgi:hypothetical protein